jgi:phospholipase D1/2
MAKDTSFDYEPHQGVSHAVAKADGSTTYPSVSARWAGARKQQLDTSAFAPERLGNKVRTFSTGVAYFNDVCAALKAAKKSIFIAGWQVNWDVELIKGTRLIDALKAALDRNPALRIYVMPWMSPKVGVNTGDLGTMLAIFQLNAGRNGTPALCCPAGLQNDYEGVEETFFSHHQKLVVVDNEIAYVGGLDLAYGRRDDGAFSLGHNGRSGCEVYNTGVPAQGPELKPEQLADYVSETSLLKVSLTAGLLNTAARAQDGVQRSVERSFVGRASGQLADWLSKSWVELPDFLREPIEGFQADLQVRWNNMKDGAADKLVRKIDAGLLSESDLTTAVRLVGDFMKASYIALLGTTWLQKAPHAELFKPSARALPAGGRLYRADQPRMPWQDVHCRIDGPSVYDLSMNFIRRWNSLQKAYLPSALASKVFIDSALMPQEPAANQQGGCSVRVLRSASTRLQQQEKAAMPTLPAVAGKQDEIHDMMCAVIDKAERFIYIENQFFQSGFGQPSIKPTDEGARSGPMRYMLANAGTRIKAAMTRISADNTNTLPKNQIAERLAARIEHAIRWDQPFHVYMVLPVHPEGSLGDIAIVGQIHWTMQSLVFASDSLVNRIRLSMAARQVCKQPRDQRLWDAAKQEMAKVAVDGREQSIPRYKATVDELETRKYLTLLNLRACEVLNGKVRTEQIYVHSKLLIADDRFAIIGSANINDRSLKGDRDSELAVCLMDTTVSDAPLDGKRSVKVRKAAHELRVQLWKKHFGEMAAGLIQPAGELMPLVTRPADPATWKAIQKVADANLRAYAKSFPFTPNDGVSIWPVWPTREPEKTREGIRNKGPAFEEQMPFSEAFWDPGRKTPAAPAGIQGFVCSLPMNWTIGENNHPDMNMALLTHLNHNAESSGLLAAAPAEPARRHEDAV